MLGGGPSQGRVQGKEGLGAQGTEYRIPGGQRTVGSAGQGPAWLASAPSPCSLESGVCPQGKTPHLRRTSYEPLSVSEVSEAFPVPVSG